MLDNLLSVHSRKL